MSANSRKVSPLAWVPTLYFAMGLPFIIVNMVATLMFRGLGIDDARITLWTSLIILPWSLKPFWSPLMEMFRTKKFWVVTTQLVSGLGLALVAMSLPFPNFFPYVIALMTVVAFSGATHDIATDGVYITELSKDLQAKFIGWQGAFYNIAKVFAMGGLVYLAGALKDHVGIVQAWMVVMGLCGGILFLLGLYHIRMLPSGGIATAHADSFGGAMRETKRIFLEFFKKKYIWIYFAFILFYRFAEGLVIKIVPLFLNAPLDQQGMGLTEQQIGLYYGTFGVIAFVVGSILVVSAFLHFPPFATLCKPTTCEILFRETNPKRDKNGTKSQENKIKNASSPTSLVVDFSFLCKGTILSREKQAKSSKYAAYQTFILHVHFQEDTASASCTDLCCLLQRPVKIRFMPFVHYGIAADAHCLGTVYNPSAIICNAEICVPSANW